jgi:hypothetical protein
VVLAVAFIEKAASRMDCPMYRSILKHPSIVIRPQPTLSAPHWNPNMKEQLGPELRPAEIATGVTGTS